MDDTIKEMDEEGMNSSLLNLLVVMLVSIFITVVSIIALLY